MLCTIGGPDYVPPGYADQLLPNGEVADGFWRVRDNLPDMRAVPRGHAVAATNSRDRLSRWFSEEGAIDWQDQYINRLE